MPELSDKTKLLILTAIVIFAVYVFMQNKSSENDNDNDNDNNNDEPIHNEGSLTISSNNKRELARLEKELDTADNTIESIAENDNVNLVPKDAKTDANILKKFRTRNSSRDGQFVYSNFADGKRGGRAADLDKFFEEGAPLREKIGFDTNDDLEQIQYANYVPGKERKMKDIDKFNAEAMLPKEHNSSWHDDPYESTSVKNTHLINIYRPIGVNTIQTTLKNPSWDIRGTPPNPKFVVSPFMNSSYEPDTNLRNQSLCY